MLERKPVAAGRFYSASPEILDNELSSYLGMNTESATVPWTLMLPHAGYIFCGNIIGETLRGMELPQNLIILCPNHTGRGKPFGVWPEGSWQTPLGNVQVNKKLAEEIINSDNLFQADALSHLGEHSIEVLLPFLLKKRPDLQIVPICIGTQNPQALEIAAKGLAKVLQENAANTGLVVSSDMNHYENEKITLLKDNLAIAEILKNDPDALLATVRKNNISMCGAGPMALALYAARDLGKLETREIAHSTSASASGDYEHTVGYAGMQFFMNNQAYNL